MFEAVAEPDTKVPTVPMKAASSGQKAPERSRSPCQILDHSRVHQNLRKRQHEEERERDRRERLSPAASAGATRAFWPVARAPSPTLAAKRVPG
jgi:hypothetical protein